MRADILPGSAFPDYELSDHTATRRKLSTLQGQHPRVLVLSRGDQGTNSRCIAVFVSFRQAVGADRDQPTIGHLHLSVELHLRAVTGKCRPDWDITDAEHKAAWARGEKDRSYPYGKSYATVFGEQD